MSETKALNDILFSLELLIITAEKENIGVDIANSIGEVNCNGIDYQIQVSLISDKKYWMDKNEIVHWVI